MSCNFTDIEKISCIICFKKKRFAVLEIVCVQYVFFIFLRCIEFPKDSVSQRISLFLDIPSDELEEKSVLNISRFKFKFPGL